MIQAAAARLEHWAASSATDATCVASSPAKPPFPCPFVNPDLDLIFHVTQQKGVRSQTPAPWCLHGGSTATPGCPFLDAPYFSISLPTRERLAVTGWHPALALTGWHPALALSLSAGRPGTRSGIALEGPRDLLVQGMSRGSRSAL